MSLVNHRGPEPATFTVSGHYPWKAILPAVYRYLPMSFVDAFFDTGAIRLSSLRKFAAHSDEARLDMEEGRSSVSLQSSDRTFFAMSTSSHQSYVLCGSTILSSSLLQRFDGCEGAIEITNGIDFGLVVARQLAGFVAGVSGHCIYGSRILMRHVSDQELPSVDQLSVDDMLGAAQKAGQDEQAFLKDQKFAYQAEYRFIWSVDKTAEEHIDLVCPDARQYCRRVTAEEVAQYS